MRKFWLILSSIVIVISSCMLITYTYQASALGCNDVQFIFARGSGEPLKGTSAMAWEETLRARLANTTLTYNFYELGTETHGGAKYPAMAVSGSLSGIGTLIGAYISAGSGFSFVESVAAGQKELKTYINSVSTICPQTQFVLGGYSQGAMLITGILDELPVDKIVYIATFGDPKLYLPEGKGNHPAACQGRDLSNYRAHVPDCHAYEGILGSYRPYQPASFHGKLGTWCNDKDIMCSSGMDIADHSAYVGSGLYRNAAVKILQKLRTKFPVHFPSQDTSNDVSSPHDLIIFWDGRLDGLQLELYKMAAQRLVNQTYALGGRVAFYLFGYSWISYAPCNLACSPRQIQKYLDNRTHAIVNSSTPETVLLWEMKKAMLAEQWQIGATKTIVVFSQSPIDYLDKSKYSSPSAAEIAELSLKIDPVNIYTVSSDITPSSQWLPNATSGKAYSDSQIDEAILAITERPVAHLALSEYLGQVGDEIVFDASDPDTSLPFKNDLRYDWDLDADGIFEFQDAPAIMRQTYSRPIDGYIQVRLTDSSGYVNTMSAHLLVTEHSIKPPTIEINSIKSLENNRYQVYFTTTAPEVLVILDDAILGYIETNSTNNLIIQDVSGHHILRLIPYDTSSRGEAVTVEIGSTESMPDTPAPSPVDPVPAIPDIQPTPQEPSNTMPDLPNHQPIISQLKKPTVPNRFIPKVPNTGTLPRGM